MLVPLISLRFREMGLGVIGDVERQGEYEPLVQSEQTEEREESSQLSLD